MPASTLSRGAVSPTGNRASWSYSVRWPPAAIGPKNVKIETSNFLNSFSQRPAEHFIPAIFIPFPQHHDCADRGDQRFETIAAAEAWFREQKFGIVIDRLRIVDRPRKASPRCRRIRSRK